MIGQCEDSQDSSSAFSTRLLSHKHSEESSQHQQHSIQPSYKPPAIHTLAEVVLAECSGMDGEKIQEMRNRDKLKLIACSCHRSPTIITAVNPLQFTHLQIEPHASTSTFSKHLTLEELANKVLGCTRRQEGRFLGSILSLDVQEVPEVKVRQEVTIMVSFLALEFHLHLQARHIIVTTMIADLSTAEKAMEIMVLHIDFHQEAEAEAAA